VEKQIETNWVYEETKIEETVKKLPNFKEERSISTASKSNEKFEEIKVYDQSWTFKPLSEEKPIAMR